jgi:hypothetical protein
MSSTKFCTFWRYIIFINPENHTSNFDGIASRPKKFHTALFTKKWLAGLKGTYVSKKAESIE